MHSKKLMKNHKPAASTILVTTRKIRKKTTKHPISSKALTAAKEKGRP